MTEQIITCPKCSQKLKIQRQSHSAIQFQCSACGQTLKLAAIKPSPQPIATTKAQPVAKQKTQLTSPTTVAAKPVTPPTTPITAAPIQAPPTPVQPTTVTAAPAPTTDLFDGISTADPTPDPLSAAPPAPSNSSAWQAPKQRTQLNLKPLRGVFVAGLILAVVGGGGYLVYRFLPAGTIASMNPLSDSPESVLSSFRDLLKSATNELASVKDAATRDRAIERLEALQEKAQDLQRRAAMLPPVSIEKHQELEDRFKTEFAPLGERLRAATGRIREQKLASKELTQAALVFSFAVSDVGSAISAGWREFPEPTNDQEKLDYEKALILRDIWRATMATVTEADYRDLASRLSDVPDRYRALKSLETQVATAELDKSSYTPSGIPTNMGRHTDSYRSLTFDMKFQTADRMDRLKKDFGEDAEFERMTEQIQAAESELSAITHDLASQEIEKRHQDRMSRGPGSFGPPSGRGPGFRQAPDFPGRPGLQEYDLGAPAEPSPKIERVLQGFVRASGGTQNLVIIRFSNLPEDLFLGQVAQGFVRSGLVRIPPLITRDGTQAAIAVKYKDSVSDVSAQIEVGSVTSTDEQRRLIFVDAAK